MSRPTKPTALKIIEGNPGKRPLRKQEPDPVYLENLEPSAWLPEAAKVVWRSLAPRLRNAKLLTVIDVEPFEALCIAVADYRAATLEMKGAQVEGKGPSPWKIVQSMAFKQCQIMFGKFAMSPQDRTRVLVEPQLTLFDVKKDQGGQPQQAAGSEYFTK